MRYTAKEVVDIFKSYPEDEVIFMWFKAREEFDGVIDISEEQWSEIEDTKDWIYDYVNTAMFDLVCEKVDGEGGLQDWLGVKLHERLSYLPPPMKVINHKQLLIIEWKVGCSVSSV